MRQRKAALQQALTFICNMTKQALERLQENKLESLSRKRALLDQGLSDLETSCELADRSVYGLPNSDFIAMYKPIWKRIQVGRWIDEVPQAGAVRLAMLLVD